MQCGYVKDFECGQKAPPQTEDCFLCMHVTMISQLNLLIDCIDCVDINFKVSYNMHTAINVIKETHKGYLRLMENMYPGIVERNSIQVKENMLVI